MRKEQSTAAKKDAPAASEAFSVGTQVNVTVENNSGEGVIVEDYGVLPEAKVDLGDGKEISPRRFAVMMNNGTLVFANSESLERVA